jgi:hypothetical protein
MRKRHRKILVAAALTALASMAILASAATAATPAPPYQDFAGCPSRAENSFIAECIKYTFSGGQIGIGNREIPVTNPIVLRGGSEQITGNFIDNAEGGIVPVAQPVPGGLIGLTGLKGLDEKLNSKEQLKLNATVELAGNPGSTSKATLSLPVKIHLQNPLLGSNCYVGSTASPINLNLAITKEVGELEFETGREEVLATTAPGTYEDSSYAVPGATGCQLTIGSFHLPIDDLVNAAYRLPSAAGRNATTLDYGFAVVDPSVVYP